MLYRRVSEVWRQQRQTREHRTSSSRRCEQTNVTSHSKQTLWYGKNERSRWRTRGTAADAPVLVDEKQVCRAAAAVAASLHKPVAVTGGGDCHQRTAA